MSVCVQLNRIGDPAEAERLLDELEQAIGVRGERNNNGRLFVFEDVENVGEAADQVAAALSRIAPQGWQDFLQFEL